MISITASLIEHTFLSILALYVALECALTIMQTHAAERTCMSVPCGFESKLSLAAVRKAADYTGDLAQANLLLTVMGAAFALFMTYGHGLDLLTIFTQTLLGPSILEQWVLLSTIVLLMMLIELPFGWWARFRVKERYGYMREPRSHWLKRTLAEALWGWAIFMPVTAFFLVLFEYAGVRWWLVAWGLWCMYLIWRWLFARVEGIFWARRSRPFENADTANKVRNFLAKHGLIMTDMIVMTRPASWDHSNVVLAGWGRKRRVVVFAHVAKLLAEDELLAIVAHEIGHLRHGHAFVRLLIHMVLSFACCAFAGWGATQDVFFEGFHYSPLITSHHTGTHAGYVLALALVTFPVLLYPLSPIVNFFSRLLQYDADRYAARAVGRDAMMRALVRLHRDYSTSLTPSRLYSLFHYRRPHAGMRVASLLKYKGPTPDDVQSSNTVTSS